MTTEPVKPKRSRKLILVLGLILLPLVGGYAYYTTRQFLTEQSEQGKIITPQAVVRELAAIAVDFLKKTIEKYKGG